MTFYWEQTDRDDWVELRCYYTYFNGHRQMTSFYSLKDEVEESKCLFEQRHKNVLENGAWKPKEGAEWHFRNDCWGIEASDIVMV